mgnify:CR=1 FL=1
MSRNTEFQFVSTDAAEITNFLIAVYENLTGVSVRPASPEKLFAQWVASVIIQERVYNNYTANQNIPSRAEGKNLDALGLKRINASVEHDDSVIIKGMIARVKHLVKVEEVAPAKKAAPKAKKAEVKEEAAQAAE